MSLTVNVKKRFPAFQLDVRFESSASRIGILGASGCGKSMTLKCIAGIEIPDEGEIVLNERVMYRSGEKICVKPQKRGIGYLFQNYALFPAMTVAENIGAGLKGSRQQNRERIRDMLHTFRLEGLEERLPGELSGGQQQRVALARIMAYEPDVILLDEPFSALDQFLKDRLQQELYDMLRAYTGTVILVSHDRDEIYRFSEELLVMDQGKAVTCGRTREVFADPGCLEAARLTGCKNISRVKRTGTRQMDALDWGMRLHCRREIPKEIAYVGFRAHEFVPVWGEKKENCIRARLAGSAELPFEKNFYILPENEQNQEKLCWFLQKDKWELLREKGMPDYLQFAEEQLLFLS